MKGLYSLQKHTYFSFWPSLVMWEQNNGNKEKKYKKIYFYSINDTQPVIEMELSTGTII